MSTPFTDALLRLWNKFALRGGVDAQNLPDSVQDAYNQVVAIQLRHMREAVEEINDDVRALTQLDGPQPPTRAGCVAP